MKANQVATLVLRLMGIYCLVILFPMAQLLTTILYSLRINFSAAAISTVVMTVLLLVGWLAVAVSLILFSKPLGNWITPRAAEGEGTINCITFEQAQVLAFAVIGVVIFAGTLPELFRNVFLFISYLSHLKHDDEETVRSPVSEPFRMLGIVGTLLKTVLGLYLFLRADGFAALWRSLKNFGTPPKSSEKVETQP